MLQISVSEGIASPDLRQLFEELYQGRNLYPFYSGQSIPMASQDVWVVCRGVVQLSTLYTSGDESLLAFVGPSMPFGLPFTSVHPYQATALGNVDLMRLSLSEIEQSTQLMQGVFRQLNRRLRQTESLLALNGHRRVRERLCYLLLLLGQEIGQPMSEGRCISVRLTHQHLANAIGTTRVTVTRLVGQLRDEGWLSITSNHLLVVPELTLQDLDK